MRDLIERQAVIDALNEVINKDRYIRVVDAVASILDVPAPKPKKGRWLPDNTDIRMYYVCSKCKQATQIPKYVGGFLYDFCPNCGADMRGEE